MKQNKKGFTLVELIVVMAIIAVLAAILVPTMLGFMNNAKFTQANANAKTVFTAASGVITDFCAENASLKTTSLTDGAKITTGKATDAYILNMTDAKPANASYDPKWDMSQYLEGMTGTAYVFLNASGTGVGHTLWSLGDIDGKVWPTKAEQKLSANDKDAAKSYKDGNPIGAYPLNTPAAS